MTVLSFQGVSKRFDGREVIRGLTISVAEHTIYGLLGQNGAGKTTTMKMALGLLKPTDGSIFVLGEPVSYGETKTNRYVGYLPDVPAFYGYICLLYTSGVRWLSFMPYSNASAQNSCTRLSSVSLIVRTIIQYTAVSSI